jgi:hypothetical protein
MTQPASSQVPHHDVETPPVHGAHDTWMLAFGKCVYSRVSSAMSF